MDQLHSETTNLGRFQDEEACMGTDDHDQYSSHPLMSLQKLFESNVAVSSTPPRLSSARLSSASSVSSAVVPPSPESPWAFSPPALRCTTVTTPSPSQVLQYHCIASLHRLDGAIYSVAISMGLVFIGSSSRRIRVWRHPECIDRGHVKSSSGHVRVVLAFDTMLFTAHKDHKIRVWTVSPTSADSNRLIMIRSKKQVTLPRRRRHGLLAAFSTASSSRCRRQEQHRDDISCMAYNHLDGLLYSASWDRTVKAWKVAEGRCVDTFVAHDERINAIVVNGDDGFVFTASSDASIKIWRRMYGEYAHALTMVLRFQPSPVNALTLSQYSSFLYSASSDGLVNFWRKDSPTSGRYHHGGFLQGHRLGVLCLMTLNRLIFSGSEDRTIRVWSRDEDHQGSSFHVCLAVLEGHRGPVKCLAACVDVEPEEVIKVSNFLVYSVSSDRMVKVWRIKVLPGCQKLMSEEDSENSSNMLQQITPLLEYDMSPVLSPSWIEKKVQDAR